MYSANTFTVLGTELVKHSCFKGHKMLDEGAEPMYITCCLIEHVSAPSFNTSLHFSILNHNHCLRMTAAFGHEWFNKITADRGLIEGCNTLNS